MPQSTDLPFRALCEHTVAQLERVRVPGVALGVFHDGAEYTAGFGVTNNENPLRVTPDTLFQIGSITKTFVGTAIMRLVEQGKIDLDAPLRTYLPDLQMADQVTAAHVTTRHLLTHTGGWMGDFFDDFGAGNDALARMVAQIGTLPQETPLGALFSYNNAGFYLAGHLIATVTGQTFEDALRELVLDPLGLEHTYLFPADVMTHRFAVGHDVTNGRAIVVRPWDIGRAAYAAGGLTSCVPDLLRYARFHLGNGRTTNGEQVLDPLTLQAMRAPQVPGGSGYDAIGISWLMRQAGDTWIIAHSGGTNGQVSLLTLVPEHNFAVVVLTNANQGGAVCNAIVEHALARYLSIDPTEPALLEHDADALQPYLGRYVSRLGDLEVSISDGQLLLSSYPKGGFPHKDSPPLSAPPPARAALYDDDRLIVTDGLMQGARAEFGRDDHGKVIWMRFGARVRMKQ